MKVGCLGTTCLVAPFLAVATAIRVAPGVEQRECPPQLGFLNAKLVDQLFELILNVLVLNQLLLVSGTHVLQTNLGSLEQSDLAPQLGNFLLQLHICFLKTVGLFLLELVVLGDLLESCLHLQLMFFQLVDSFVLAIQLQLVSFELDKQTAIVLNFILLFLLCQKHSQLTLNILQ